MDSSRHSREFGREEVMSTAQLVRDDNFDYAGEYQRKIKAAWVQKQLVKGFDFRLFGRPIVIKRANGSFIVVDGAHRIALAEKSGVKHVPVIIHEGLTFSEEIQLFRRFNRDRSNVSSSEIFHSDCLEGDEVTIALDEMLIRNGLNARPSLDRPGMARWASVEALKFVHGNAQSLASEVRPSLDPVELSERAIRAYQAAWPNDKKSPDSWLFKGIADWVLNPRVTGKDSRRTGTGERDMRFSPLGWQEAACQLQSVYGSPVSLLADSKGLHPNDYPGGSSYGPVGKYLRSSKFLNALKKSPHTQVA